MRAKKLICLAFSLMLVSGGPVGCSAKEKQVDSKVSIEQNKKEDYKENLAYLMKDISEQSKVVSNILTSQKSVEEKKKEFNLASKDLLETSEKVKKLKHDEKYKDVQFTMDTAMGLLDMSLKSIGDGLELKDRNLMEIGNDAVVKASKKIDEANKMLKDIK
ncbi:tungsten formylmethanofuran dehydrogenase [Bacillus sp. MYb209]|uniref:tungsten formylmethanofuran dehydrogenase n=1 Tax=Bacillus sp. MYb209 TaxID=1848605 RepID=UPI000CFE12B1|nr:tungsten formylmethanofuran dehydrogenase [Bacillus sp. MYb209]PQZ52214.1 tungsten formylmethanofuran dehydrogenase [Bacillus sp. MYb209]